MCAVISAKTVTLWCHRILTSLHKVNEISISEEILSHYYVFVTACVCKLCKIVALALKYYKFNVASESVSI